VLPSLSRLMKSAIGEKLTRKDHGDVSNQLVRDCAGTLSLHIVELTLGGISTRNMRSAEMLLL